MKNVIYVTGDLHGDENRLFDRQWRKLKKGDTLIVCGDFGFLWDGSEREREALEYLGSRKYNVLFLDGTHENFDLLHKCRETVWHGGHVRRVSGNLLHLMRGQIFNIEGKKIFTFGGGESADRDIRIEQGKWWRAEMPTADEFREGAQNLDEQECRVDYILTHEPPQLLKSAMQLRQGVEQNVSKLNGFLEEISRTCEFKHWYFGSLHEDKTLTPKYTCVFKKIIPLEKD